MLAESWVFYIFKGQSCLLLFANVHKQIQASCFPTFLATRNYGALRAPPLLAPAPRDIVDFMCIMVPAPKKNLVLADL